MKLLLLTLLEIFVLNACATSTTPVPNFTNEVPSNTPTVTSTKNITPSPSITLTPSLEPINGGWSTFYSPEFGFSIQYPAIFDKGFQSLEFTCNISVEKNDTNNLLVVIGDIPVIAEKTNKNLAEYTNYYIENRLSGWKIKQTEIKIDGLSANRLEYYRENPPRSGSATIVVKENNVIIIQYIETNFLFCDLKDDNHSSYWIYERVIESLKFRL